MNRTRRIVAAGIGTAVILAIVAIVALSPNLHTQTPVSTGAPTSGGPGNGGASSPSAGGNNTATNCTKAVDDHEWDDQNETNDTDLAIHPLDDGNETNETAGACNATAADHDWKGDEMSDEHQGHGDDNLPNAVVQDALVLVSILSSVLTAVSNGLAPLGGLLTQPLGVWAGSGTAPA